MLEAFAKNLWLLVTLVVPGLFTFGVWRLLLLLEPSQCIQVEALKQIDGSTIVSLSVIIAVALLQQSIAIVIEAALTLVVKSREQKWPHLYTLFYERFELAAIGKLDENTTRTIGNLFLSINIGIGLFLLLVYFLAYENMDIEEWIPISIIVFLTATIITAVFRMFNAKWVVEACKKNNPKVPCEPVTDPSAGQ